MRGFDINPGGVLLSHIVTHAVPSALEGLTTEFGMGSGMTPPTLPPKTFESSTRERAGHQPRFTELIAFLRLIPQRLLLHSGL